MIACPKCGEPMGVEETRTVEHYVRRRRRCPKLACGVRVSTAEFVIATAGEHTRPLGDFVLFPKRDLERMIEHMTQALATRMGTKAVVELIDRVLQGTDTDTTGGQDGNDHGTG